MPPEEPLILAGNLDEMAARWTSAQDNLAPPEQRPDYAAAKRARMRHGVAWLLPDAAAHWARARAVSAPLPMLSGPH